MSTIDSSIPSTKTDGLAPLDVEAVLAAPPPSPDFVLPGLSRGSVGAIVGPGGTGKTMLALQIAVSLALGIPVAGGLFPAPKAPMKVSLVTGEEGANQLTIRLHAIVDQLLAPHLPLCRGVERARIAAQLRQQLRLYPCVGKDIVLLRRGTRTAALGRVHRAITESDIVLIETVSRLHDGDENATSSVAALLSAVEWLAQTANAGIVLLHHTSKFADLNGLGGSQHAARGSSAFVDNIRWMANLFNMSQDEAAKLGVEAARKHILRFEITKANHIPPQEPMRLRRGEGGVLRLAEGTSGGKTTARRGAHDR